MSNAEPNPMTTLETGMSNVVSFYPADGLSKKLSSPQVGDQYIPITDGDNITVKKQERKRGYNSWAAMKQRCENPKHKDYSNYGGKGIGYCAEWESFSQFICDMGPPPFPDSTLDRIDSAGGYSPQNCRWADKTEQARNRTTNRQITYKGRTYPLAQWAALYEMNPATLSDRIKAGWPIEEALLTPIKWGGNHRQADAVSSRSAACGPWPPSMKHVEYFEDLYRGRSSDHKEKSRAEFYLWVTQQIWDRLGEELSGAHPDEDLGEEMEKANRLDLLRGEAHEIVKGQRMQAL